MRKGRTLKAKETITTIMLRIRSIKIFIANRLLAAMKTAGSYLKLRNHFEIISEFIQTRGHTLGKRFLLIFSYFSADKQLLLFF